MAQAFISVGANIKPEENIREAVYRLAQATHMTAISMFYRGPAIDRPDQPDFYNGVVGIETDLSPAALKRGVLHTIEAGLGRNRSADKYAARTIDLDLLLYDDWIVSDEQLRLPNPDIVTRAFVAIPLYELAPDLVLPDSGVPIREVAERFETDDMKRLPEYTRQLRSMKK
jgi:dihydroneopterin aldolase/2-amino-4-hydroxy-6-hydroxymethyldihydropteridine diphosphokinase